MGSFSSLRIVLSGQAAKYQRFIHKERATGIKELAERLGSVPGEGA